MVWHLRDHILTFAAVCHRPVFVLVLYLWNLGRLLETSDFLLVDERQALVLLTTLWRVVIRSNLLVLQQMHFVLGRLWLLHQSKLEVV